MSAIHEYEYRQSRRREQYLDRIRSNTRRFADRYAEVLLDIREQGLAQFVSAEINQLERELKRLNGLINSDPEEARDMSVALGDEIYGLRRLAREARKHVAREEQQRIQLQREAEARQREQAESLWQDLKNKFDDPIVRDFAHEGLLQLQNEFLQLSDNDLRQRCNQLKTQAEQQATEWKAEQRRANRRETQLEVLEQQEHQIQRDLQENPEQLQRVLDSLRKSRVFLSEGGQIDPASFQEKLVEQVHQADEAVTDERSRRLTVKGVVATLQEQGFQLVGQPRLYRDAQRDEVVIQARRLSGRTSEFRVSLDGGFRYKFEHYEGMACKDDIESILPKLRDIYGVELCEKEVIWENPDRNLRSARSLDDPQEYQHD